MTEKELRIQSLETMLTWEKAPDDDKPEIEYTQRYEKKWGDKTGPTFWAIDDYNYRIKKPKNRWLETGWVKCPVGMFSIVGTTNSGEEILYGVPVRVLSSGVSRAGEICFYTEEEMDKHFTPVKSLGED